MDTTVVDAALLQQIIQLKKKFASEGQHLYCRLDGLMNAKDLKYWDYISLDVLLNLQQPKTDFPDEMVFILYHQLTELYFKMIRWEIDQIIEANPIDDVLYLEKLNRIVRYYEQLVASFDIMVKGMDYEQFHSFRTALFPASGFQSVQYRLIELSSTDLINLVDPKHRATLSYHETIDELYEKLYWKQGAIEVLSGKKDLSLIHFENKYDHFCREKATSYANRNLWQLFQQHLQDSPKRELLIDTMRKLDRLVNVEWTLSHYRAAAVHLQKGAVALPASGGTNWKEYLPPRYQKIMFFPRLWSEEETYNWGKNFIKA